MGAMPVELVGETDTHYRFSSDPPGFSEFVVTASNVDQQPLDLTGCSHFGFDLGLFVVYWYWWLVLSLVMICTLGAYIGANRNHDGSTDGTDE